MNKLFMAGILVAGLAGLVAAQGVQKTDKAPKAGFSDWPKGTKPASGYYDKLGRTVPTENAVNAAVIAWGLYV